MSSFTIAMNLFNGAVLTAPEEYEQKRECTKKRINIEHSDIKIFHPRRPVSKFMNT
jgi:hypothetical protein